MNGILNENQLTIVKEYENNKPLIHKIDSIFDTCFKGCLDKFSYTFKYRCIYHNEFKKNAIMK